VRSGVLAGLNVTVPHKVPVIGMLDELADSAQIVGAVNTVVRASPAPAAGAAPSGARLVGHNTDVGGFREEWLAMDVPAGPVAIAGAGGAARAVAWVLNEEGRGLRVVARRLEAALDLAGDAGSAWRWDRAGFEHALDGAVALVNATPAVDPVPAGMALPHYVVDLIAWPLPTPLEVRARAAGSRAAGGLHMLVAQAAHSFALWTGLEPPVDVMRRAVAHLEAAA
jgi:shikimate dehydrogenase